MSFEIENDRTSYSNYYLPKVEIKDCNVKLDGKNFFDQPINSDLKTSEKNMKKYRKIVTSKGDYHTTCCLLVYSYFRYHYKTITIELSKQQVLDADPRAIQQINFKANLDRTVNSIMSFIIEEAKETTLDFSQITVKLLWMQFHWMWFLSV